MFSCTTGEASSEAVGAAIKERLDKLNSTGSVEASQWLEQFRDASSLEDSVRWWRELSPGANATIRFFLAQVLAAKFGRTRKKEPPAEATAWLLALAISELEAPADAAARHLGVAAAGALLLGPIGLLRQALCEWPEMLLGACAQRASVAGQLARLLAEEAHRLVFCSGSRSASAMLPQFEEAGAALCGAAPALARANVRAITSGNVSVFLQREALQCLDAWLHLVVSAEAPAASEAMLLPLAEASEFMAAVPRAAQTDPSAAATLTTMVELAVQVPEGVRSAQIVLQAASEAAVSWWPSVMATGNQEGAVQLCVLLTGLAPRFRALPSWKDHLAALLVMVRDVARWPREVGEAALEPWSAFLNGEAGDSPDPRTRTSPTEEIHQLFSDLTRALAIGMRFDVTDIAAAERFRDRSAAILVEWRLFTSDDKVPELLRSTHQEGGHTEWSSAEVHLFLLSTSSPRICRTGSPSDLALILREFCTLPATFSLQTPSATARAQLQITAATFVRKSAGILAKAVSDRAANNVQVDALRAALSALLSQDYSTACAASSAGGDTDVATLTLRASQLSTSAVAALAREGAWLCMPDVLTCLRSQLWRGTWSIESVGTFVRTYCSIISELPDADALSSLELLCGPMLERVRSVSAADRSAELQLLMSALRTAPVSLSCEGEPCAIVLLSAAWADLEPELVAPQAAEELVADLLPVTTIHSEAPSVRGTWLPRLISVLRYHAPRPWTLRATTALCEVFLDTGDVLQPLVLAQLAAAHAALLAGSVEQSEVFSAAFDLLAAANAPSAAPGLVAMSEAEAWARLGLEELPRLPCSEAVRSVLGHLASVPARPFAAGLLAATLLSLVGSNVVRLERQLPAAFARPVHRALEALNEGELAEALAVVSVPNLARAKFQELCQRPKDGTAGINDLARGFRQMAKESYA